MVLAVSVDRSKESFKGRRHFGQQLQEFMVSSPIAGSKAWPPSLAIYYKSLPIKARNRGLTVSMLLDWLAQETGIIELGEASPRHKSMINLLGRYIRWGYNPDSPGGEDVLLLSAIAHTGIIKDQGGHPITDVVELTRLLRGTLDTGD